MPGHIKLTVERKLGPAASTGSTPEPWESSTTTDSTVTIPGRGGVEAMFGNRIPDVTLTERKLSSSAAHNEHVAVSLSEHPPTTRQMSHSGSVIDNMRNPVLDRITGSTPNKLRFVSQSVGCLCVIFMVCCRKCDIILVVE